MAGEKIVKNEDGSWSVPNNPIVPFIEGDGIGPEVWNATRQVLDAAVAKAYQGKRKIEWMEIFAGEKAKNNKGEWLPEATMQALKEYAIGIKGPLTTPVGDGIRSLNVTLRQDLDLFACIRPVKYVTGVVSPVKFPEQVDMVIFRENTEDVYAGVEWKSGSEDVAKVINFLNKEMNCNLRDDSGIGVKPMSPFGSKRLIRKAINYAIDNQKPSVTIVHKGNIMKFTEGGFRAWGYELVADEFADVCITEQQLFDDFDGVCPDGKVIVKDRIADAMFQEALLHPADYSVLALPNLNGDYISDALAAQVGGLGIAPGANIGDTCAMFEATHGTAPTVAGMNIANPSSLILSGAMLLEYLGWAEAVELVNNSLMKTIGNKTVTVDLASQMSDATELSCTEFTDALIVNL